MSSSAVPSVLAPSLRALAEAAPPVAVPAEGGTIDQDSEWFLVKYEGAWRELRLHDYPDIYSIEGLYEKVVYDLLRCRSPEVIRDELVSAVKKAGGDPSGLTVLDLGAGNGIMAERLKEAGIAEGEDGAFIGADLIPEAAEAAERDRPGIYDEYVVGDITDLPAQEQAKLASVEPDVLTCVAALGFGDIPPEAFIAGFEKVRVGGWVAFCIRDRFVDADDGSGFSRLIDHLIRDGVIEVVSTRRYVHRVAFSGEPIEYVAYIARKCDEQRRF
ncbi:MAG: class I SAM-dependent DNA methyltransferase [Phycisphaerales bacterium]